MALSAAAFGMKKKLNTIFIVVGVAGIRNHAKGSCFYEEEIEYNIRCCLDWQGFETVLSAAAFSMKKKLNTICFTVNL